MTFATIGAAIWSFAKKLPAWIWFTLGALILGKLYLEAEKGKAADRERAKQDTETAKERERVLATSQKEIDNVQDAKDAAIAAPDSLPEFSSADELRVEAPAISRVILRDRSENERGS